MWGLDAGDLVAGAIAVLGLIVGGLGLRKASEANIIAAESGSAARQAVEKAETANRLSETANGIATGANALSQESIVIAREANAIAAESGEVAQQAVEKADTANRIANEANDISRQNVALVEEGNQFTRLAHQREEDRTRRQNEAVLKVVPGMRSTSGETSTFAFRIENIGQHPARDLHPSYIADGITHQGQVWKHVTPGGPTWEPTFYCGALYGGGIQFIGDWQSPPPEHLEKEGELRVAYTDGNGSQLLRKRIVWEPGRFTDRNVRIEDWPDEPAPAP